MNSKEIKKVKYQGNDIKKIMHAGGVIWQGLKTWKKYSVKKANTDKYKWKFISREKTLYLNRNFFTNTVFYLNINGRREIVYDGLTIGLNGYYYAYGTLTNGYTLQIGRANEDNTSALESYGEIETYKKQYETKQVQGDYIEDVEAEENTYPKNGIKGDYWYVLQE